MCILVAEEIGMETQASMVAESGNVGMVGAAALMFAPCRAALMGAPMWRAD